MSAINTEFGRGNNLNSYRGTTYYTSSGGPFTFPSGAISFNNFYGTQATSPTTFTISPAVSGITNWSLSANGPLNLGSAGVWNITMVGTTTVTIKMWGAGSYSTGATGAAGGFSSRTVSLTSGTTYCLRVGNPNGTPGGGARGASGTEGGGLSGVFSGSNAFSQGSAILIAGGGGGAQSSEYSGYGTSGAGGGSSGQGSSDPGGQGGGGGSQNSGGAPGAYNGATGGSALQGGNGGFEDPSAGGGGGGGWFGGGGSNAGGAGGGSGYAPGGTTTAGSGTTPGNSGDGNRGGAGNVGTSGRIYISL